MDVSGILISLKCLKIWIVRVNIRYQQLQTEKPQPKTDVLFLNPGLINFQSFFDVFSGIWKLSRNASKLFGILLDTNSDSIISVSILILDKGMFGWYTNWNEN